MLEFLKVSEIERSFCRPLKSEMSESREIVPAMTGSQKSSPYFSLSDLDSNMIKKESSSDVPFKSRVPNLRSKDTGKKRKTAEVVNVDEPGPSSDFGEDVKNITMAVEQMTKFFAGKIETIDDMVKIAAAKTKKMEEDDAYVSQLQNKIKDLQNKAAEEAKKLVKEKEDFLDGVKKNATTAVLEARILMESEIASKGIDTSLWDVSAWKKRLAELMGEDHGEEEKDMGAKEVIAEGEKVPLGDDGKGEYA